MQITVKLPCSVREIDNALHRVANEGYWDTASFDGHRDIQTGEFSLIITYGKEKKNDSEG